MEKIINNKGITLVALVITIIILLILAGISISAITNTGLFANAKLAREKTMEAQLEEELRLAIQSIQTEEVYKGNSVTLESLAGEEGQLKNALQRLRIYDRFKFKCNNKWGSIRSKNNRKCSSANKWLCI